MSIGVRGERMTDNMTDITLKKEKIQDLRAKHLKYKRLLDEWPNQTIPVQEVRHWLNDLVSPILPELTKNGLKSCAKVDNISDNQKECDSEINFDSNQTKALSADIDDNIPELNHNSIDSDSNSLPQTEDTSENNCENNEQIDSGLQLFKTLNKSSDNSKTESKDKNEDDYEVSTEISAEPILIETGAKDSDKEVKDSNRNQIDSIGSELSSEDSDNKSTDKSMSGSVRTRLRPKCDNKVNHSSDSSDVEFNDSSDIPESNSNSDSDFQVNGKSGKGQNSHIQSKYERLSKDFRLKYKPIVELINLNEDLIEAAINDTGIASESIKLLEKNLFDSLSSKGVVCRKMIKAIKQNEMKKKKDIKEDESDSDKELKRLCRIPKIGRNAKNGSKREKNGNDSTNSENSESDKKHRHKKLKTSTPLSRKKKVNNSDSELESDCEVSTLNSSKINSVLTKPETKLDALDSDVSSDEEVNGKDIKSPKKKTNKKSESEADNESDGDVDDKKDVKKLSTRPSRSAKKEETEDKTVIELDSDEEIVHKKNFRKGRVSDDEDYDEKHSDSSVIESSDGMDPSASDSNSPTGSDSDTKSKKSKKKSKKSKSKDKKGKRRRRVVCLHCLQSI